jgi:hypothetical protein
MKTENTIKRLSNFIQSLIDDAENDTPFEVTWFDGTKDDKFSIVGGWVESDLLPSDRDLFCLSKANPKYIMAIKIAINPKPCAHCAFETLSMPMDINDPEKIDDTLFVLEWDIDTEAMARFIYGEWERITKAYQEV